jgi:radical SAM superfamily enzyme YgiQ (UPF0313 family)
MRVSLINPPRSPHNAILAHASPRALPFIHRKLVGPPLGLLTVAAVARRDHDVFLLETKGEYDLHPDAPPLERLVLEHLRETRPDVVGVTVITSEFDAAMEVFRVARRADPRILTVAGGLHATACPADFAGGLVDVVCPGPSAHAFADVVHARETGRPLASVPGVFVADGDALTWTGDPGRAIDAAGIDFVPPDRSYLAPWLSTYRVGKGPGPATYLFTSLGCPYSCSFCSIWPLEGGVYRQRDVDSVIDELRTLEAYPVVRFADANTLVDPRFLDRLFDRIAQEGIAKQYVMDLRADAVADHPRLIEKLARGGLVAAICGFESFRDEELAGYRKSLAADRIREAIAILHGCGVEIRGNYVVPPDYGEDDFAALADYAGSHRVAYAGYTVLTPMPGTRYHAECRDRIVDRDRSKYNFFNAVLKTRLPPDEFHARVAELWAIKKGTDVI